MKTYLSDGAYAEIDQWGDVVLTTEDGRSVQNRVVLEPCAWQLLVRFVECARQWPVAEAQADGGP